MAANKADQMNNKNHKLSIFLLLIFVAGSAFSFSPCEGLEKSDALNLCLGKELHRVDRELNSSCADIMQKLAPERKEILRKSEVAWIESRDKDCEFEASSAVGGDAYQPLYISCQIKLTKNRLQLLQNWRKQAL